jgi:hypothetical protein
MLHLKILTCPSDVTTLTSQTFRLRMKNVLTSSMFYHIKRSHREQTNSDHGRVKQITCLINCYAYFGTVGIVRTCQHCYLTEN